MKRAIRHYRLAVILGMCFLIVSTILISNTVKAVEQTSLGGGGAVSSPLDLSVIGAGTKCFVNYSGYAYFLPLKSWAEYSALVNNGPAVSLYQTNCCDNNVPSGVYSQIAYFTDHDCGHTPGCQLQSPLNYQAVGENSAGATCGFSGRWRAVQCASMLHKPTMCEGDPCVTGVDHSSYGNPRYCFGHYDTLLKTCIYEGKTAQMNSANGTVTYATPQSGGVNTAYGVAYHDNTNASWGACYTQSTCGNGICSSSLGETCSSCPSDCGACPQSCGDYNCSGTETCSDCPTDCGSCTCGDITDYTTCINNSCSWDWDSLTCVTACSGFTDESGCQNTAGCVWDYYNYTCASQGVNCGYFGDQYSCQGNGCVWNPYGYTCN